MKAFELRHSYPWSREAVWTALDSPEYAALRARQSDRADAMIRVEPISDQVQDRLRVRRVRHTLSRDIPRMMRRFTGPTLSYLVEEQIHPDTFTVRWTAIPEVARGKKAVDRRVQIRGEYRFEPGRSGAASCERIVKAEITVAIPGLSGRIEEGIAKSLRATHESSATLALRFLEETLG
jgi:hypothetical protein